MTLVNVPATTAQSARRLSRPSIRPSIPADLLAEAVRIFGSAAAARTWFAAPAIALEQRRPSDMVGSPAGCDQVRTLLGQIRYGVYV
jgi:putative toxin-antitoxin system antitoxin component (TIGR02293 family)